MHGGPSLRRGDTKEGLNIPSGIGWVGKDIGRLVTWEFPLRTDSASWKSLESFIQFNSFCNSCIIPVSSRIVSWSSTNLRLATVSKLLQFFQFIETFIRCFTYFTVLLQSPFMKKLLISSLKFFSLSSVKFSLRFKNFTLDFSNRVLICASWLLLLSGSPRSVPHRSSFCWTLTTTTDWQTSLLVESDGCVLGELREAYPQVQRHRFGVRGKTFVGEERRRVQELCVGLDRSLLEVVGVELITCGEGVLVKRVHTLFGVNAQQVAYDFKCGRKWKECDRRCVR